MEAATKPTDLLETPVADELEQPDPRPVGPAPVEHDISRRPRDVRRKRPPAFSLLLRWDTARRAARVIALLALDFAGVSLAIFTALALKAVVHDQFNFSNVFDTTPPLRLVRLPRHGADVRSLADVRGRGERPGSGTRPSPRSPR